MNMMKHLVILFIIKLCVHNNNVELFWMAPFNEVLLTSVEQ